MDLTPAQQSLNQVALLASVADGVGPLASANPAASAQIAVGALATGVVLGATQNGSLVGVLGRTYVLQLPNPVSVGEKLDLQVLRLDPVVQFRLVTNPGLSPPASTEVSLSSIEGQVVSPAAPIPTGPDTAALGEVRGPEPASIPFTAPVGVGSGAIGEALSIQLQQQFELQASTPDAVDSAEPGSLDRAAVPLQDMLTGGLHRMPAPEGSTSLLPGEIRPSSEPIAARFAGPLSGAPVQDMNRASGQTESIESLAPAQIADAATPAHLAASADAPDAARGNATASTLSPAVWSGQVWSGQAASVSIEPDRQRLAFEMPALNAWKATLKLSLPHLGAIDAQIHWSTAGLKISVDASDPVSANQLRDASLSLLETLRSLQMRVQSIAVRHG